MNSFRSKTITMNNVFKAKIKKTGEEIQVYKLTDGRYNIYLGEKISVAAIEQGKHNRVFKPEELEIKP